MALSIVYGHKMQCLYGRDGTGGLLLTRGWAYLIALTVLVSYSGVDSFADRLCRTKGKLVMQIITLAIAVPIFAFCVHRDMIIVGAAFIFVAFCSVRRMVKIVKNRTR